LRDLRKLISIAIILVIIVVSISYYYTHRKHFLPIASLINGRTPGIVSITDFGARCDGKTDDTQAFKDAIASGYPVYIPPGTTVIDQTIVLPAKRPVFIYGTGRGVSKILVNSTIEDLFYKDDENVFGSAFRDFSVYGNNRVKRIFDLTTYTGAELANLYLTDYLVSAIRMGGGNNLCNINSLHDLYIRQYGIGLGAINIRPDYGIEMNTNAVDNMFDRIFIATVKTAGIIDNAGGNNYSDVHIWGYPDTPNYRPQYGIITNNGRILISQCYLDSIAVAGVRVNGPFVSVEGCQFLWPHADPTSVGVEIGDGVDNVVVADNIARKLTAPALVRFLGTIGHNVFVDDNSSYDNGVTEIQNRYIKPEGNHINSLTAEDT